MLSEACDRCFVMFCTFEALFFWDDKTEMFWNAKREIQLSFMASFLYLTCFSAIPRACPFSISCIPCSLSFLISSQTLLSPSSFPSFSSSFYPMLALLPLHQILKQISHEISSFLHPLSSCRSLLPSTSDIFSHSHLHGLPLLTPPS